MAIQDIVQKLEDARKDLLDLSGRNRLIHYPLKQGGKRLNEIIVVDERPERLYQILVVDGKPLSFLALPEVEESQPSLLFDDRKALTDEIYKETLLRNNDNKVQTAYKEDNLENRLRKIHNTARTYLEEQGVNALYLALGVLQWYESKDSQELREAPLILLPVELYRDNIRIPYRIRYSGEDISNNLSLQEKLKNEFGIELPPGPEDENFSVTNYFATLQDRIADKPRWAVNKSTVILSFFRFNKLLMYNDLKPDLWPDSSKLVNHSVLQVLLGETEFKDNLNADFTSDDTTPADHDTLLSAKHVIVDADTSQMKALLAVRQGRHLVIQGPPGTGKSQTITNIIADAIGEGKTVLFVAEKMAALEVVKRRLDHAGLGDVCLELHSQKSNKKAFLNELQRVWDLGKPKTNNTVDHQRIWNENRVELDEYCQAVNAEIGVSKITPYQAYGFSLKLNTYLQPIELPDINLKDLTQLSETEFRRKLQLVADLQAQLSIMGVPMQHLFWCSRHKVFTPANQASLSKEAQTAQAATRNLQYQMNAVAELLGLAIQDTHLAAQKLYKIAAFVLDSPNLAEIDTHAQNWQTASAIIEALENALQGSIIKQTYDELWMAEAWAQDLRHEYKVLQKEGRHWWRALSWRYSKAYKRLSALSKRSLPSIQADLEKAVNAILEVQRLSLVYDQQKPLLQRLFGSRWLKTEWKELLKTAHWLSTLFHDDEIKAHATELLKLLNSTPTLNTLASLVSNLQQTLQGYDIAFQKVRDAVNLDEKRRFQTDLGLAGFTLTEQAAWFAQWQTNAADMHQIITYNELTEKLGHEGLEEIAKISATWPSAASHLTNFVKKLRYENLVEIAWRERPRLIAFSSEIQQKRIERFQELDKELLIQNSAQLLLAHWSQLPRYSTGGQFGLLTEQFQRKRRHKSIRVLMSEAGQAIQTIKPVFMMSPFSIAAFLPPGSVQFDLVIFDEASQVKPIDALGAIVRGRQVVVVGDDKQLPPTAFFDRIVEGNDEDDSTDVTADTESILKSFLARSAPKWMLLWHYRSRHESLIAVSNHEFYNNQLIIFPSPDHSKQTHGLVYHPLPQAIYLPGADGGYNLAEAQAVAVAVMQHARTNPEQSLLVATFNLKQRDIIEESLDKLRKADPSCEQYFRNHPEEPFVIKNLENVQGDERAVVFISVGYGRDAHNKVSMNFGPLNKEGGERRLNVLITRARYRCEIYTNLSSEDIDLSRTKAGGVKAFKRFLKYAQTGDLDVPEELASGVDSPFEQAVADALIGAGYSIHKQVGTGGYRIDLAVVDDEQPGRYLLGIECDGATYHSARSARDRDRLRQKILEEMGWRFHRIWSTDWFRNPNRELQRVIESIERAKAWKAATVEVETAEISIETVSPPLQRHQPEERAARPMIPHYQLAHPRLLVSVENIDSIRPSTLIQAIVDVVKIETPVHIEEVLRRLVKGRVTQRVRESFEVAIAQAVRNGSIRRHEEFLWSVSDLPMIIRDRSNLPARSRQLEYICTEELTLALEVTVEYSVGIKREEVAKKTLELLGYTRSTAERQQRLEDIIVAMVDGKRLIIDNGRVIKP